MRMIAGLLAMLLLVAACTDKDRLPSGILEKEKMEKVLWDMMEADQYAAIYLAKDTIKDSAHVPIDLKMETLRLYQEVFRLHQVTREEFSKSFAYYRSRPDLTRGLFDSLLAKGNRLRTENYNTPHPVAAPPPVIPATVNPAKGQIPPAKGLIPAPAAQKRLPNSLGLPHGFPIKPLAKPSTKP